MTLARLTLVVATLCAITIWLRRQPDFSDHHVHVVPRCSICEWDRIERRLGA